MKHHKGIPIFIVALLLENLVQSRGYITFTPYLWIATSPRTGRLLTKTNMYES